MPAEEHPVGTFPPTEASPSPEVKSKSLSELQELVEWPSKMVEFVESATPPPTIPEPEPPPPVPVEPAPVEPPPTQEAAPAEPAPPAEPEVPSETELMRLQLEALEAHSKKLEAKYAGREAGERGYINQLKDRIRRLEAGGEPEPIRAEPDAFQEEPVPARDNLKAWAVQQAAQQAHYAFREAHPDIAELEVDATRYLQESGFDFNRLKTLDDPLVASREVTRVLEEAYWAVKETRNRNRIVELQTKRADQVRGLEEAKRRATVSAAGSTPPPPAPRRTTKDLSLSELEAQMKGFQRR